MNDNNKTPQKGFLRSMFSDAGNILSNLRRSPHFSVPFSYLVLPLSLPLAAGVLAASQLLAPLSGMLFPTAEEYLEKRGYDPKIAAALSDHEIRIRSRDAAGLTHAALDFPTIFAISAKLPLLTDPYNAYAYKGISFGGMSTYDVFNQCQVLMPGEDNKAGAFMSRVTGIPEEMIENFPVSDEELFMTIAFHEFRHCHTDNDRITPMTEGDADDFALKTSLEIFKNKELVPAWIYFRAMAFDDEHNSALYLDHLYRGLPVPSEKLIHHANKEAAIFAALYLDMTDSRPPHVRHAAAFRMALEQNGHEMSALAKRRAQLYIEAAEYFAPSSMGVEKPQPDPAPVPLVAGAPQLNS